MAKFRAPSTSVASTSTIPSRKPCAQRTKKAHVTARPFRARNLDKAKVAAKDAAKRFHVGKQLLTPCSAYVGNIGPNVDERKLMAHFHPCGKVLAAKIHCCGGVAMTSKPPPTGYLRNLPVCQYGIVTFASNAIREKALTLGGTLDGRTLTVGITISELPEILDKITARLNIYRERQESSDVRRAEQSALRSLRVNPTVLLDPTQGKPPLRKRIRILGISLPEGIL